MIPYIDYQSKDKIFAPTNPFTVRDERVVVFIDRDSFTDVKELEFLLRQADGERLQVISTAKEGSAQLIYDESKDDMLPFTTTELNGSGWTRHAILFLDQLKKLAASPEIARWATAEKVERAFIAAKTAESMRTHVFITEDRVLLDHKDMGFIAGANPLCLADGMALLGLILRRRNDYEVVANRSGSSKIIFKHSRWLFFWYATRDLLPASWWLVTGCAQMPDDKCRNLALTAISRTADALKCRDHIHEQVILEQTNSSTEDAMFYLDFYLISLTAAFDVLARIADEVYLPTTARGRRIGSVGWRKRDWLSGLANQDATLAALMSPTNFHRDVLEFIAKLRNYIHDEGLQAAMHSKNGKPAPILLHVPKAEVADIADIITRLSGSGWTVDRPQTDMMFLEIGDLVERMTPFVVKALNEIMNAIDITRVPGHDPTKVQTSAPAKWASKAELADIRKLLGL